MTSSTRTPFTVGTSTGSNVVLDDTTGRIIRINNAASASGYKTLADRVLPPEIGNLTELEYLRLHSTGNHYLQIPPEIGRLTKLETLTVGGPNASGNGVGGTFPAEIGQLTNLKTLDLSGSRLSGPIPPEIGNLTNLETLDLRNTRLSGLIPAEIGNLTNLEELRITDTRLSGPIPPEIGQLTKLEALDLSGLSLSGRIPPEIGNLTNLVALDLSSTHITGMVPPELGNLTNLGIWGYNYPTNYYLYPKTLGSIQTGLDISYTDLWGPLPVELAQLGGDRTMPDGGRIYAYTVRVEPAVYDYQHTTTDISGDHGSDDVDLEETSTTYFYEGAKRLCAPKALHDVIYRYYHITYLVTCKATELELRENTPRTPNKPLRPSMPVLAPNDQQLTVSWGEAYNGGSPITAYDVQYKQKTTTAWTTVTRTDATATTETITGLTNNVAYQVRVNATNAQGSSPWSDIAEAKPTDVTVTAYQMDAPLLTPTSQRIALVWSAPAGITPTGYEIRYREAGTPTWTSHPHTGTGTSNTITNNIVNNTTYQVQLRTTTASTTTLWSASAVGVFGASSTLCTDANGVPIACVQSAGCT